MLLKLPRLVSKYSRALTSLLISILLASIPSLFWGDGYIVGGDDSGLYYVFPKEFLESYLLNIIGDNVPGGQGFYFPQLYQAPFFVLIYAIKLLIPSALNTQMVMFGLNLCLAFWGFIYLVRALSRFAGVPMDIKNAYWDYLIALLYTFSPYLQPTIWSHLLSIVYIHSVVPWAISLFINTLIYRDVRYFCLLILLMSIFLIIVVPYPYILALVLCSLPFFLYLVGRKPQAVLKYTLLFGVVFIISNTYVFGHFGIKYLYEQASSKVGIDSFQSEISRKNNHQLINYLSKVGSVSKALQGAPQVYQEDKSNRPSVNVLLSTLSWSTSLLILSGLCFKKRNILYLVSLVCWMISLCFYSLSVPLLSSNIFLWLHDNMPLFSGLRNAYDKFSYALGLWTALSAYFSIQNIPSKHVWVQRLVVVLLMSAIVQNSYLYITGKKYDLPHYGNDTQKRISALNNDYINMTKYLRSLPYTGQKMLWFPQNHGGYALIEDSSDPLKYYVGLSPNLVLTSKNDYAGQYNFPSDVWIKLEKVILNKDESGLKKIMQDLAIGHVILNMGLSNDVKRAWFTGGLSYQDKQVEWVSTILKDMPSVSFGTRYKVISLGNKYAKFSITNHNGNQFAIPFTPIGRNEYIVSVSTNEKGTQLKMIDSYSNLWKISDMYHRDVTPRNTSQSSTYNSWSISELTGECVDKQNACTQKLRIFFYPQTYVNLLNIFSLVCHLVLVAILLYYTTHASFNKPGR